MKATPEPVDKLYGFVLECVCEEYFFGSYFWLSPNADSQAV
jgi:hypothetical protein